MVPLGDWRGVLLYCRLWGRRYIDVLTRMFSCLTGILWVGMPDHPISLYLAYLYCKNCVYLLCGYGISVLSGN